MTLQDEIKLITEILTEEGNEENDEALLIKKIWLLERIIGDPVKYREYDNLELYSRYEALKNVAREISASDVQIIEDWKIPIERKIEKCQEKVDSVSPANMDETMKQQKRDLYVEIIGEKSAHDILKGTESLETKLEALNRRAKKINGAAVEVIERWTLSDEQQDYMFVESILSRCLNSDTPTLSPDEAEKLNTIKAEVNRDEDEKGGKIQDTPLRKVMRNLLNSSKVEILMSKMIEHSIEVMENAELNTEQAKGE